MQSLSQSRPRHRDRQRHQPGEQHDCLDVRHQPHGWPHPGRSDIGPAQRPVVDCTPPILSLRADVLCLPAKCLVGALTHGPPTQSSASTTIAVTITIKTTASVSDIRHMERPHHNLNPPRRMPFLEPLDRPVDAVGAGKAASLKVIALRVLASGNRPGAGCLGRWR